MQKHPLTRRFAGIAVLLFAAFLLINLPACRNLESHGGKDAISRPVKAPLAISFLDAKRLLTAKVPDVTLTLIDPGGEVVAPNGIAFTSLVLTGGFVSLALKDSASFSIENPYRFAIKLEAPGYSTNYQTILVTQNKPQYLPVFMVRTDDPPEGMMGYTGNIAIAGSRLVSDIVVSPNAINRQNRMVTVKIRKGTVLLSHGEPLKEGVGNIAYRFSYGSPAIRAALRTFPGGPLVTDAVDSNGKSLATPQKPLLFTTAGWMTLEMASASQTVTGFSIPAEVDMPVNDTMINPITSKPYRAGDNIDIWSLSDQCVWKLESSAVVKASPDGLVATMLIEHLSTWNMDFATNVCNTPLNMPYNNASAAPINAYCEVINTQTGLPYGNHPYSTQPFPPGTGNLTLVLGGIGEPGTLVVFDNSTGPGNVVASSNFKFCDPSTTPTTLNLSSTYQSVTVDFMVQNGTTQYPLCSNAVYFQDATFCGSSSAPYYGGNLTVSAANPNVGTVTLSQPQPFGQACIQLFYAGINTSTGNPVAYQLQTEVNFSHTTGVDTDPASTPANITFQFVPASGHFQITIPGGGPQVPQLRCQ